MHSVGVDSVRHTGGRRPSGHRAGRILGLLHLAPPHAAWCAPHFMDVVFVEGTLECRLAGGRPIGSPANAPWTGWQQPGRGECHRVRGLLGIGAWAHGGGPAVRPCSVQWPLVGLCGCRGAVPRRPPWRALRHGIPPLGCPLHCRGPHSRAPDLPRRAVPRRLGSVVTPSAVVNLPTELLAWRAVQLNYRGVQGSYSVWIRVFHIYGTWYLDYYMYGLVQEQRGLMLFIRGIV